MFTAAAALACAHAPIAQTPAETVIAVVSRDILLHAKEAPEGTYLLIETQTRTFELTEQDFRHAVESGIPLGLLRQLLAEHPHRVAFPSGTREFRPVTPSAIARIFANGPWWDRFYRRFPNSRGFVGFCGPVFNRDATEALIGVDYNCFGDCGWGGIVHLQRQDGKWVRLHEWLLYIS
ncbi:MAG TPA: hypothetical protein VNN08_22035 [Thermoanaerobaculia bacterium]|nr:hypothetical protein [Thermoanaerobaculia bacterium]